MTNQAIHEQINAEVKSHAQEQFTPIIIRQVNAKIQDWKLDERRMIREALGYKAKHVSTRKAQNIRLNVCLRALKKHICCFLAHIFCIVFPCT